MLVYKPRRLKGFDGKKGEKKKKKNKRTSWLRNWLLRPTHIALQNAVSSISLVFIQAENFTLQRQRCDQV